MPRKCGGCCGKVAGEIDNNGRTERLHLAHIVDRAHGGQDTYDNLPALRSDCTDCNQGAINLTAEPPRWVWLKNQLHRTRYDDQRRAYEW